MTTFPYRIALFASGMVDGPGRSYSENTKLPGREIEWSERHTNPPPQAMAWEFYGDVGGQSSRNDGIDFVQLPSRLRGISLR
jgi:hypothetical protein